MDDKQKRKEDGKAGSSLISEDKNLNPGPGLAHTVLKHTFGLLTTSILQTASKLEIFDILYENGPEMTVAALAEKIGASEVHLTRLLNACVHLELLETKTTEAGEILYSNMEEGEIILRNKSEKSLLPYVNFVTSIEKEFADMLDEAVMKGRPLMNLADIFGTSKKDIAMPYKFDQAIASAGHLDLHFPRSFDFSKFLHLIDCGGGLGIHAKSMKLAYPNMIVTVLETDSFIDRLKSHGKRLDNPYFSYVSGDFFQELPSADLYMLSHILHDWPDEKCDIILHNIYEALPSGGGLLILEQLYNENKDSTVDYSLDMMMMLVGNGKERTREEYKFLLEKQGFEDVKIVVQIADPLSDVIFARKPFDYHANTSSDENENV